MPLLPFRHTLMTRRGRLPRMLVPLPGSTCFVSSTSPPLLPSPMAWTCREMRRLFSFSTLVAEPVMSPSSLLKTESSMSWPLLETPTWEEGISTTAWSTISFKNLRVVLTRIYLGNLVPPWGVFVLPVSARSIRSRAPPRRILRLTPSLLELVSTPPSLALCSRKYAWNTSISACPSLRRCCEGRGSERTGSMILSLWGGLVVSP
mmetsp:Transcript_11294/g.24833  ORF Transcript_11294/g.24833 Transcript_11294/m.24833 type:complete len:205 (+) Transcript_11294:616-1230(+)